MDSHETYLTGDDDIIVTKTIRSVSGMTFSNVNIQLFLTSLHVYLGVLVGKIWFSLLMVISDQLL